MEKRFVYAMTLREYLRSCLKCFIYFDIIYSEYRDIADISCNPRIGALSTVHDAPFCEPCDCHNVDKTVSRTRLEKQFENQKLNMG